ncbi:coproporphyrinogen-III oxidase family protein [Aliivibrio fischeri]|uniref:coproporphyrinogen-III oxidase family protein n=1 Tax=Aliivibrio fischeri TaxID=668 RepID=UPI00166B2792|nr:radical SAM protein [Aliivibrio fischeri]USR98010.1 radical SAM protein [Aliivibrio fischeri ATCC 7744 = JCM 18803 = DSM 507]GGK41226.1 coproporphyrinogen III oxidase [Aliivibrio fischeri]
MEIHLRPHNKIKFNAQFPIYNFFFPSQINIDKDLKLLDVLSHVNQGITSRALYFHFPFCETICSFCPFTKGIYKSENDIDRYVSAIIKEIKLKAKLIQADSVPVEAIFFGGGTPSLLSPEQIKRVGQAIIEHFDLSKLKEFSFEIEVKSLTLNKILAMKAIGVTHPRFGLQTFNKEWRQNFALTATLKQIKAASELLNENFHYVSFDILYGMHGQTIEEIKKDLDLAIELNTTNIDIYPIDNVMTQAKLHKLVSRKNYPITKAIDKHNMRIIIDKHMRKKGFMPHNGHGYFREIATKNIVSSNYSFVYHEHVYGYSDKDLIGFGVNAVSSIKNHVITNISGREAYINSINNNNIPCSISKHTDVMDLVKPLLLRLPYHGEVEKKRTNSKQLPAEFTSKLRSLIDCNLIEETEDLYKLTKEGWEWYSNIMYYLMPQIERNYISQFVYSELNKPGKNIVVDELIYD